MNTGIFTVFLSVWLAVVFYGSIQDSTFPMNENVGLQVDSMIILPLL